MTYLAVVTGAAGAIGQEIAAQLAPTHDAVVLVDVDGEKLKTTHAKLESRVEGGHNRIIPEVCNITDPDAVKDLARRVSERGTVRTLVNNAGATHAASLHEMTVESWKAEVDLNLNAAFLCFQAFSESLKACPSSPSVVNVASANGLGMFGNPAYSAAKAGLIHLTRSIAVEYGRFGIRCNAVAPGTVKTPAWEQKAKANPNVLDEVKQWYPMQRIVEVRHVASTVAFLASAQAGSITGVCLPVDCGLLAGAPPVARAFAVSEYY